MPINYDKYINSTGTHYISNSGGDEKGGITGGKAGDQTGKEWQLKPWYSRPWTHVFRHPNPLVRRCIAELAIEGALNDKIGYDQYQRTTFWAQLKASGYRPANITVKCEEDCSAGVAAIVKATGYLLGIKALQNVSSSNTSRNTKAGLKAAGFTVYTASAYTGKAANLLPGDILLYENHHVATNVTRGKKATGEVATHAELEAALSGDSDAGNVIPDPDVTEKPVSGPYVMITGDCHIRSGPDTKYASLGIVSEGTPLSIPNTSGWQLVQRNGIVGWVSGKYASLRNGGEEA